MEQLIQLLYLDELDPSGIIYPYEVVQEAVKDMEDRIQKTGGILGECSIPVDVVWDGEPSVRYMSIDLGRVSHIVKHVWIEHKKMMCKVKLLGQYAEIPKHLNVEYEGVPRSTGVIEGKEPKRVCTKYTLVTVDLALTDLV